ncbi:pathogenicity island protein [Mammaliicoccus sciuri]|uniref:pathogenicity island protein n=2 Tax=Mammaliicoccus TaxID=2803850 RepID=UPI00195032F6|nr:pathogenicity island protein [Mammaliicoccus sciuri]MEB7408141.1 pathogenicity island protein [Mammaliicoccus sciuri]QYG31936.1 pathogenicity island protein [Mammaliicoccus sciuri]UXV32003.1 pathogenicity island protein [Mammaliicoccus sciuri]WQK74141.1 pathogenicity island protein [Mammaliicoccus sciuri]
MVKVLEKQRVQELPTDHRQVVDVITNAPNKYITRDKVLRQLRLEINQANYRWLASIINDLVLRFKYPIGSCRTRDKRGYYIITSKQDKDEAINTIESIIKGNIKRLEALKSIEIKDERGNQ